MNAPVTNKDAGELPVIDAAPSERADAARNRERILAVAAELFDRYGADNVSMDQVAEAAGVGKGTLYRRFGSRCALARTILDERERELQESLIRGAPPLGPGAPPRDRLIAFAERMLAMLDEHGDLMLAAEAGSVGARFRSPVYAAYRAHVRTLVEELNPDLEDDYVADVLLAALSAEQVNYWRSDTDIDRPRMMAGFTQLIDAISV